ncbi:MAG TPA: alpha-L-fucosidase [bacterium]|nr:alpha-L-fucosidase [bacterium]
MYSARSSFGLNRNEDLAEYKSATELIHVLIQTVCNGGNLLLDIGPTGDGRIPVIMEERLIRMGEWLAVNGEAIYGTRRWRATSEGDLIRYTQKGDTVYAICLEWPGKSLVLETPKFDRNATVSLLGYPGKLSWTNENGKMKIDVPSLSVEEVPCLHAYTFRLDGVK